jgi:hypothetical protein
MLRFRQGRFVCAFCGAALVSLLNLVIPPLHADSPAIMPEKSQTGASSLSSVIDRCYTLENQCFEKLAKGAFQEAAEIAAKVETAVAEVQDRGGELYFETGATLRRCAEIKLLESKPLPVRRQIAAAYAELYAAHSQDDSSAWGEFAAKLTRSCRSLSDTLGENSELVDETRGKLADAYTKIALWKQAAELYQVQAEHHASCGEKETAWYAILRAKQAEAAMEAGNLESADELLRTSLKFFRGKDEAFSVAYAHCVLKLARLNALKKKPFEASDLVCVALNGPAKGQLSPTLLFNAHTCLASAELQLEHFDVANTELNEAFKTAAENKVNIDLPALIEASEKLLQAKRALGQIDDKAASDFRNQIERMKVEKEKQAKIVTDCIEKLDREARVAQKPK